MSALIAHAKRELQAAGYAMDGPNDPYNQAAVDAILELIEVFSEQDHSGFSASYCLGVFTKLAAFEPLGPLTGADSEWNEASDGVWQNNRCSHVFKQVDRYDGKPYDINAVVLRYPDGCCVTGAESRRVIEFPYTPRSVTCDIPADATDDQREMLAAQAWAKGESK